MGLWKEDSKHPEATFSSIDAGPRRALGLMVCMLDDVKRRRRRRRREGEIAEGTRKWFRQ